jgi:hypothetical protein
LTIIGSGIAIAALVKYKFKESLFTTIAAFIGGCAGGVLLDNMIQKTQSDNYIANQPV